MEYTQEEYDEMCDELVNMEKCPDCGLPIVSDVCFNCEFDAEEKMQEALEKCPDCGYPLLETPCGMCEISNSSDADKDWPDAQEYEERAATINASLDDTCEDAPAIERCPVCNDCLCHHRDGCIGADTEFPGMVQVGRYIAAKHELFGAMIGCEFTLIDEEREGHRGTLKYDYGGRIISVECKGKFLTVTIKCYLEDITGFKVHQDKFALTAWVR